VQAGDLPQRLLVMGRPELPAPRHPSIARGAVKLVLDEHALPALDVLARAIADGHARGRPVAVHCVTRTDVVLAVAAFEAAGAGPGDRLEHASVASPDVVARVAALGLTVVTQPGFVRERGDAYLTDVEAADRPWLYRLRGFLAAGVRLGGGTDAPFGDPDPWRAMQAAVARRTGTAAVPGAVLGAAERLEPEEALALFTSDAEAPGGPPRRIAVGARADLCLLDRPWSAARAALSRARVHATIVGGSVVWRCA
jgi:predicted amidohydrolase YtcJ